MNTRTRLLSLATALSLLGGCSTNPYTGESQVSNTAIGAGTGAALGAGAGAIVGATTKAKTGKAALIGAGIGALAGGGIGAYMDVQESKIRQQLQSTGVSVTRQGDNIILNMPSDVTFGTDEANIRPNFYSVLDSVALVLKEYDRTRVNVAGYTDSDGSDQYNLDLSRRRAQAVAQYLISKQLNGQRFRVEGMGESQPVASNTTAEGKAQNRRVEITIIPVQ